MRLHFHLSHFHLHSNQPQASPQTTRDVEAGQRNVTATAPIQRMDDAIDDSNTYHLQQSDTQTHRSLPILSGVMIPFSIMLSIPGLTGHWYIRTDSNVIIETRPNPRLLDVGLGLSMACAILASIFLIVRFTERCVKHMTLASIALLTLHDLINIPAVTIFGVIHRFDDGFTYGQSFWFTVCSTIVSSATNITLVVDYVCTRDFATSGSGLTSKQRSLMIIVMVLLSYISFGSFVESKLLGIPFLDALYFSIVSIEAIGFGDIYPNSVGSRIFTCFYIVGGIIGIALVVGIARDVILESAVIEFQHRLRAQRHHRRLRSRWRAAISWRLRERGHPTWINHNHGLPEEPSRWYDRFSRTFESLSRSVSSQKGDPAWKLQYGPRQKRLNIDALTDEDWNAAALETGAPLSHLVPEELRLRRQDSVNRAPSSPSEHGHPEPHSLTHFRLGGMLGIVSNFATAVSRAQDPADGDVPQPERSPATVVEKGHEEELNLPRSPLHGVPLSAAIYEDDYHMDSLEEDAKQMFTARFCIALSLFFAFWLVGSAIFMKTEKWPFWNAAYFCFISFLTVGYGDFSPKSPAGMSIFVVWALLGVATMTILISVIMEGFSQRYKNVIKSEVHPSSAASIARFSPSEHPADQGPFSPSSAYHRRGTCEDTGPYEKSIPTITKPQTASDALAESSNDSRYPQSVPIQVGHLKSLIKIARAHRESELEASGQLEILISHLEKTLRDVSTEGK